MATGITPRHKRGCRVRNGGDRCNCSPSFEAWVSVKRDGRNVKLTKTFPAGQQAAAKAWRTDAIHAAARGAAPRRDGRTLAAALRAFVDGMKVGENRPQRRVSYKPATIRSYDQHLRKRIEDSSFGLLRVTDVRLADVQDFVDARLAEGDSPATVANALCVVQAFYRRAVKRGELAFNPASGVDIPAADSGKVRIAHRAEAAKLIAALPEPDRPLWATGFYAGLRRGELQALRWCDVDFANSRINVERGWDQYEGATTPKSVSSVRTVPMLAVLRDYLDEHKLRTGGDGEELVFGRTHATPFSPPSTDRRAKRHWKAGQLVPITLHECRHTFASLLIDAGANPKAIQTFMGHSKIQTTFDIYGHLMPGSHDEVRERMDAYLRDSAAETQAVAA